MSPLGGRTDRPRGANSGRRAHGHSAIIGESGTFEEIFRAIAATPRSAGEGISFIASSPVDGDEWGLPGCGRRGCNARASRYSGFRRTTSEIVMSNRLAKLMAGFTGFSAVFCGAFGAHLLRGLLEKSGTTQIWQTGVLYHLVHAVVLLVLSGWRPVPRVAYFLILVG